MEIICRDKEITIRALEKSDTDMESMYNWLNSKEVNKYYGDGSKTSIENIKKKYESKIEEKTITPCIIEYEAKNIGYVQFYKINYKNYEIEKEIFEKIVESKDIAYAIDIFIAESTNRNKGIGTRTIKLLIETLFKTYNADIILIDPKTNNTRAIKCYKKCGFKECFIIKEREEQNGIKYDNVIMEIKNTYKKSSM